MGNIRLQSQRDHKCQCPFCHAKVLFFLLVKYGFNLGLIPRLAQCLFLWSRFHFSFIKSHQITIFAVWLSVYLRHIYRKAPLTTRPATTCHAARLLPRRRGMKPLRVGQFLLHGPMLLDLQRLPTGMPWDAMGCRDDKWWNQPGIAYLHSTKTSL